ncbi:MAG: hypothetical protein WCR54_00535 [Clostridia bacterium]
MNNNDKHNGNYEKVTSIGQWLLTIVLLAIPIVNIVFFIIWAFGGGDNKNRTNYIRASIIPLLVAIILSIILGTTGTLVSWLGNISAINSTSIINTLSQII